jgi:DNA-3-methyladenine glycosylase II
MHTIPLPAHFSFAECMAFLGRSDREILHKIEHGRLIRPWRSENRVCLLEISQEENDGVLCVRDLLSGEALPNQALDWVREMFDLDRNLQPFYSQIKKDQALAPLLQQYRGLRLIRIPDLFETLAWTIIGQQINLAFAYSMKSRLVEAVGDKVMHNGQTHCFFPKPEQLLQLSPEDLRGMQYSRQKIDYLLTLANTMASGDLNKSDLLALEQYSIQHKRLLKLRGIGPWSADYTLLKCLGVPSALPLSDAGLHNALRNIHKMDAKPDHQQIQQWAEKWKGWEGYVTFFLWRSLVQE